MADPAAFLYSLAQALSVMALYPAGHPSRERAIDMAYQHAEALSSGDRRPFTFLEDALIATDAERIRGGRDSRAD